MAAEIRTKRIYDDTEPGDGARVLIMRLWPRGVRKDRITVWLKELGPVRALLDDFLHRGLAWEAYRRRYVEGLQRPEAQTQLREVLALAERGPVTLLCGCADEHRCHRSLLRAYLEKRVL